MKILFALALFLAILTPSARTENAAISYTLSNLRPMGYSYYQSSAVSSRQYFQFQNEQGAHYVVYEEAYSVLPLRESSALRTFSAAKDDVCRLEVDCRTRAFCTGDCKNMYYELTNATADPTFAERNNCTIRSFSCERGAGDGRSLASAPGVEARPLAAPTVAAPQAVAPPLTE